MFCGKCGSEFDDTFSFCPKCGEQVVRKQENSVKVKTQKNLFDDEIESPSNNLGLDEPKKNNSSCALIVLALIVFSGLGILEIDFDEKENNKTSTPTTPIKKEEIQRYTAEDALRDAESLQRVINTMKEDLKPDFSAANRYANHLNDMNLNLNEIISIYPNEEAGIMASKLKNDLPKIQQKIFPRIRKAWVKGLNAEVSEMGVRVRCANSSCNEISFSGQRYLFESNMREDDEYYNSKFVKFRVKRTHYKDTYGRGFTATRGEYYKDSELK